MSRPGLVWPSPPVRNVPPAGAAHPPLGPDPPAPPTAAVPPLPLVVDPMPVPPDRPAILALLPPVPPLPGVAAESFSDEPTPPPPATTRKCPPAGGERLTSEAPPPPPPVFPCESRPLFPPWPPTFAPPLAPCAARPGKMPSTVGNARPDSVALYSPPRPPAPPPVTKVLDALAPEAPSAVTVKLVTPNGTRQAVKLPVAANTHVTETVPEQFGFGNAPAGAAIRPSAGIPAPASVPAVRTASRRAASRLRRPRRA